MLCRLILKKGIIFLNHFFIYLWSIDIYTPNHFILKGLIFFESPQGGVANALDWDIVVNEFELQSCYYVSLWTNTVGKGMNFLNLKIY